jgi:phosphoserine phosphatase
VRKLCVFDLDGTLIPHDSFGRLVRQNMAARPSLFFAALARKSRLLSRTGFAEFAHQKLADRLTGKAGEEIAADVLSAIIPARRARIEEWRGKRAFLVLLSASPHEYVSAVGEALGFDASHGSQFETGGYLHLHGAGKRLFIDAHYPASEWSRAYAIADSNSDAELLSGFEVSERV